ncbi:TetR/AcrR family transcriptional regulator [Brevibacterium metallidurans]|uniref:TetR/AcrR family transcriptional regulator n=1 Tax=Brevibacterium metallidurans TaxID=1482676 RepID=A0ABP3CC49_9MICO
MARPARFSDDDILDGAASALAEHGPRATIADVAAAIGGPTGSIYHRFASRDEVFARLWLRSIGRFHAGLLAAYGLPDPREAVAASARHVSAFCRDDPLAARSMLLHRQSTLAAEGPAGVRDEAAHINDDIDAAMDDLLLRRFPDPTPHRRELLSMGTRLAPYGIVRPFIGGEVPAWVDDAVAASAQAIVGLGD